MTRDRCFVCLVASCLGATVLFGCRDHLSAAGSAASTSGTGGSAVTTSSTSSSQTSAGGAAGQGGKGGAGGVGGGGGATTSSVTTGPEPPATDHTGATCQADADCGDATLTCITATSSNPVFGGGPAHGYCSRACNLPSDCQGMDQCLLPPSGTAGAGLCVRACSMGPGLLGTAMAPLNPEKCFGRSDLYCSAPGDQAGLGCLPSCGTDASCSGGLKCDPRSGLCVANPSTGSPIGASCDASASPTTCAADCVPFSQGPMGLISQCTQSCVFSGDADLNCGGRTKGVCAYGGSNTGSGDRGSCAPVCQKQGDCQSPSFFCYTTGPGLPFGCLGATPCPNGQSDCAGLMMNTVTCQMTQYGPECIDTAVPS